MKTMKTSMAAFLILLSLAVMNFVAAHPASAEPIAIADVQHDGDVDFETEILPILQANCLACHNATEAESDLILETPQTILKGGGEGPAVVAGKSGESLLLKLASHQMDPVMPPEGNERRANNLTPQQLGLIKLWIDQGAKGEVTGIAGAPKWQPLPPGVNPVYAVSISPDGQYVAAGRANQIFIYHVPSKREVGRLTDPELLKTGVYNNPGVAHWDLVQSLAFAPDNRTLASGGYRTVKIWQRPQNVHLTDLAGIESTARSFAVSADGKFAAVGQEDGKIKLFDLAAGTIVKTLEGHGGAVTGVAFSSDSTKLVSGSQDKSFRLWNVADGQLIGEAVDTPAPVNAVALVAEDKQVATGGADNVIRLWTLPGTPPAEGEQATEQTDGQPENAEAPKPIKELAGHGGPITSLAILSGGTQLVSGSQDATARIWDVNGGNQIRSVSHGGPVTAVAVRADGQRLATTSSNNSAKLWNAANGQQIAELKGDFRARINADDITRAVALAKRHVDLANADLKAANDRKTAEEDNQKKADEAMKKADEEFKTKEEAAKKPVADKEAADKELEEAKAALAKAEEAQKAADEDVAKKADALKLAQDDLAAKTKGAADADNVVKDAAEKLKQAQEAAKAEPDKKELADAAAAAEKALQDAEAAKKAADDAKAAAEKAATDADAAKKAADEAKKKADQELQTAKNNMTQADNKVKQLAGPAQKAIDEKNAAERALQAAKRSLERANQAVEKATDAVPVQEAAVKKAEEAQQQVNQSLESANKAAAESEKPLHAVAFSSDGSTLATAGDDQIVHTWDSDTGAAIDSLTGQGAPITLLGFTPQGNVISVAQNNTAVVWDTNPQWQLTRVIGSPDSTEQLVDRVTALDFSSDGKLLATGSGEPSRSGELKIWNVEDGSLVREIVEPHSDTIFGLEFSPDDQFIASCGADRFMKVFSVADGQFVKSFEGHTHHVLGVGWSADGRTLATSGADNVIKIWNFLTGDQQRTIAGFNKEVTSIQFIGVGSTVVASAGDNSVQIKNADNGGNIRGFGGSTDFVYCARASADGKVIVAGGQDSVVRIWQENGQTFVNFTPPQPEQTASTGGGP